MKINRLRLLLFLLLFSFGSGNSLLADEEHEQHGKHVHGVGELNLALEGNQLYLELHVPAVNIVGFEHVPHSAEEEKTVRNAIKNLEKGEKLFLFSKEAGCRFIESHVETSMLSEEHGHEEEHDEHHEEEEHHEDSHSDFEVSYRLECESPQELSKIFLSLFLVYPGLEELEAQIITKKGQRSQELTPAAPEILLK